MSLNLRQTLRRWTTFTGIGGPIHRNTQEFQRAVFASVLKLFGGPQTRRARSEPEARQRARARKKAPKHCPIPDPKLPCLKPVNIGNKHATLSPVLGDAAKAVTAPPVVRRRTQIYKSTKRDVRPDTRFLGLTWLCHR